MKKSFLLFLLISIGRICLAQSYEGETPFLVKSFSSLSLKNLEAKTTGGNIILKGGNTSEAKVEVYVSSENGRRNHLSKEEIQKRLDEDYELTVKMDGNKLSVIAREKSRLTNWNQSLNISFYIFVPQNISSNINTSGGNISLSGLAGEQVFGTSGGNLEIRQVSGKITGHTSGGNIEISGSKDIIDLTTSGGNIDASHCTGNIKLHTSGGNLGLHVLDGSIKALTSGGNVDADRVAGDLIAQTSGGNLVLQALSCSLDATTSGGDADVEILELRKYVKINNSSGTVNVKLPSGKGLNLDITGDEINTEAMNNFNGAKKEHSLIGKLNGGGTPVEIEASSGRVNISFH
jgi:Putative adhesin